MEVNIYYAMLALPVIFMIHEFEEIIMVKKWLGKNEAELKKRFSRVYYFMKQKGLFKISTEQFAVAVLFEFILLSGVCFVAVFYDVLWAWLAVFMAYFLHLLIHLSQWVAFGRYVPGIMTTISTLLYCILMIDLLNKNQIFSVLQWILSMFIGSVLMAVVVSLAHFVSKKSINLIHQHNSEYLQQKFTIYRRNRKEKN